MKFARIMIVLKLQREFGQEFTFIHSEYKGWMDIPKRNLTQVSVYLIAHGSWASFTWDEILLILSHKFLLWSSVLHRHHHHQYLVKITKFQLKTHSIGIRIQIHVSTCLDCTTSLTNEYWTGGWKILVRFVYKQAKKFSSWPSNETIFESQFSQ